MLLSRSAVRVEAVLKKSIFRFLIDSHINDRLSIRTSKDRFFIYLFIYLFLIKIIFYISLSELLPPAASLNSRGRARSKNNSRTIMASGSDGDVSRSLKGGIRDVFWSIFLPYCLESSRAHCTH